MSREPPPGCSVVTEPFWPVEDTWPPGTLTEGKTEGYKMLEKLGRITLRKVYYAPSTGVTRIRYDAMEPDPTKRAIELQKAYRIALMEGDSAAQQLQMGVMKD